MAVTWNPSDVVATTLSNGNLTADPTTTGWGGSRTTVGANSGKWYWEIRVDALSGGNPGLIRTGIALISYLLSNTFGGAGSYTSSYFVSSPISAAVGDIVGVAWDADNLTLKFYKNNVHLPTLDISGITANTYYPAISNSWTGNTTTARFAATSFSYSPPAGYSAYEMAGAVTESVPLDRLWAIQSNGPATAPLDRVWGIQAAITEPVAVDRLWGIQVPTQDLGPLDRQWEIQAFDSPPILVERQWGIQVATTETVPVDRRWAINPPFARLAATAPHARVQAWGGDSTLNRLTVEKPHPSAALLGGGVVEAVKPRPTAAVVMTGGGERWTVSATKPHPVAAVSGWAWSSLQVGAVAPRATIAARSGWAVAVTAPHPAASGHGQHRLIADVAALKPHPSVAVTLTRGATLTVSATAPHAVVGTWAQAAVSAPHASVFARFAVTAAAPALAYVTNLRTNETTQYDNYPFRWIVRAWGRVYGVGPGGLYRLEGDTDNGAPIAATVETRPHLLGTPAMKFVPVVWISGAAPLRVRGIADGQVLPAKQTRVLRAIRRAELGKGTRGRVWAWQFENLNGGRIALRTVDPEVIPSGRKI